MADSMKKSPHVLDIDDKNFESEVMGSPVPVLVDFGATWCGPCKVLLASVEALAAESLGSLRVGKIDTDDAPAVSARFGVRAVPTVILFREGKEVARHVGLLSKEKLRAFTAR
jgi:thioredoxin 1